MASDRKVRVAIVGLGFGAEFIPIYQAHPDAEMYAVCRRNRRELDACGDKFGIKTRYTDFAELLKDPNIDAVHINSPIPDHAGQSLAALKAGKHVACTVPMATSIDDCRAIVEARRISSRVRSRSTATRSWSSRAAAPRTGARRARQSSSTGSARGIS